MEIKFLNNNKNEHNEKKIIKIIIMEKMK